MLAVMALGVAICVILVLNVMQSFKEVLGRLENIEARLDALTDPNPENSTSIEKLPPPDEDF
jgi:hypothetical protein